MASKRVAAAIAAALVAAAILCGASTGGRTSNRERVQTWRRWFADRKLCTTVAAARRSGHRVEKIDESGNVEKLLSYHVVGPDGARLLERLCRGRGHGRAPERAARQLGHWARCRWPSQGPRSQDDIGLHRG